jgi:hypothetical protein
MLHTNSLFVLSTFSLTYIKIKQTLDPMGGIGILPQFVLDQCKATFDFNYNLKCWLSIFIPGLGVRTIQQIGQEKGFFNIWSQTLQIKFANTNSSLFARL